MAGNDSIADPTEPREIDEDLVDEFLLAANQTLARLDSSIVMLERETETDGHLAVAGRSLRTLAAGASHLCFEHLATLAVAGSVLVRGLRAAGGAIRSEPIEALWSLVDAARDLLRSVEASGRDDDRHHGLVLELRRLGAEAMAPDPSPDVPIASTVTTRTASTLPVERTLLDELAALSDRLLLARNELAHHQRAGRSRALDGVAADIDALTAELRSVADRSRLEPLARAWSRLPRQARDLAHRHGKLVEVQLESDPPMVDQRVVAELREPIAAVATWLIEEVVESPAHRTDTQRPSRAPIHLAATAADGWVRVEVTHDGPPSAPPVELVGAIERLGGHVEVAESALGVVIRLRVPAADRRLDACLVRCAGEVFAVPAAAVEETFRLDQRRARIQELAGAEVLDDGGRVLPLIWLREVLCFEPPVTSRHEVLVIDIDGDRFGLVVDRLLDREELLPQTMAFPVERWGPFAATTVCGSGEVAVILDVRRIVDAIGIDDAMPRQATAPTEEDDARRGPIRVLAARIGESTLTIPTALVDDLATVDVSDFVSTTVGTTIDDGRGPITVLALPNGPQVSNAGRRPIIVHERDGVRFGIAVDEVLGEHHFPPPSDPASAVIGIAASPIIGDRATDGIDIERLIAHAMGRAAGHG